AINPEYEVNRIGEFLRQTLKKTGLSKVVIGLSGGIDSATSLMLAVGALGKENVHVLLMPYKTHNPQGLQQAKDVVAFLQIPQTQVEAISIDAAVDAIKRSLGISEDDTVRLGNIMARVRMIMLFDRAKKRDTLVLGTENKSEYLLGYFTRGGDELSDIEPVQHLYKTQVYELANYLGLPPQIIEQSPTAGLWHGQTDEGEFGFSYKEADQVLYLYFDRKMSIGDIKKKGFANAENIVKYALSNQYKHKVPYSLSPKIKAKNT
ncbi:MAG: NAD+ synthase, partial [Candidatus Levybacteria bacterium]|nr:NAD+ synthase [Candidatus Levybacteria bacterium]